MSGSAALELKALQEKVEEAVTLFRSTGEQMETEVKTIGEVSSETKAKVEKVAGEVKEAQDALKEKVADLELKMARMEAIPGKDGKTPEESKEAKERKTAFFEYLKKGKLEMEPDQRKALVEDATGQILVPEDLDATIYRSLPKITVVRNLATIRPTTRDRVRRRTLTEVSVGWGKLETGTAITESTPTPDEAWQYVEDLYGLTKIGEDELDDTDVNLEATMADSFRRAIAEAEDTGFVAGTGHANGQPEGMLTNADLIAAAFAAAGPGAVTADDLTKLQYEVAAQYRRNGVYVVNSATELEMMLLKDTDGQYLWQPSLQADVPPRFRGKAVYSQDDVPQVPDAGTEAKVAIFGDVAAGYRIIDRRGMTLQRLLELYAESGLIGLKVRYRVGGGVIRSEALSLLSVPAA